MRAPKNKLVWDVTMSLDGFIADPKGDPGKMFDWYFSGDTLSVYSSKTLPFKLTKDDAKYFDSKTKATGAIIAGRRTYDYAKAWGGSFFIPVPFFVLTHRPPHRVPKGTTKFTFVTDGIESAVAQAKFAAGKKEVNLMGANIAKECIEADLLDEIRVHIAPFLMGDGVRLHDYLGSHWVELKRREVIASSSGITHISFNL